MPDNQSKILYNLYYKKLCEVYEQHEEYTSIKLFISNQNIKYVFKIILIYLINKEIIASNKQFDCKDIIDKIYELSKYDIKKEDRTYNCINTILNSYNISFEKINLNVVEQSIKNMNLIYQCFLFKLNKQFLNKIDILKQSSNLSVEFSISDIDKKPYKDRFFGFLSKYFSILLIENAIGKRFIDFENILKADFKSLIANYNNYFSKLKKEYKNKIITYNIKIDNYTNKLRRKKNKYRIMFIITSVCLLSSMLTTYIAYIFTLQFMMGVALSSSLISLGLSCFVSVKWYINNNKLQLYIKNNIVYDKKMELIDDLNITLNLNDIDVSILVTNIKNILQVNEQSKKIDSLHEILKESIMINYEKGRGYKLTTINESNLLAIQYKEALSFLIQSKFFALKHMRIESIDIITYVKLLNYSLYYNLQQLQKEIRLPDLSQEVELSKIIQQIRIFTNQASTRQLAIIKSDQDLNQESGCIIS